MIVKYNGLDCVSSLTIAKEFNKNHKNVLKDIEQEILNFPEPFDNHTSEIGYISSQSLDKMDSEMPSISSQSLDGLDRSRCFSRQHIPINMVGVRSVTC